MEYQPFSSSRSLNIPTAEIEMFNKPINFIKYESLEKEGKEFILKEGEELVLVNLSIIAQDFIDIEEEIQFNEVNSLIYNEKFTINNEEEFLSPYSSEVQQQTISLESYIDDSKVDFLLYEKDNLFLNEELFEEKQLPVIKQKHFELETLNQCLKVDLINSVEEEFSIDGVIEEFESSLSLIEQAPIETELINEEFIKTKEITEDNLELYNKEQLYNGEMSTILQNVVGLEKYNIEYSKVDRLQYIEFEMSKNEHKFDSYMPIIIQEDTEDKILQDELEDRISIEKIYDAKEKIKEDNTEINKTYNYINAGKNTRKDYDNTINVSITKDEKFSYTNITLAEDYIEKDEENLSNKNIKVVNGVKIDIEEYEARKKRALERMNKRRKGVSKD